MTERRQRYDCGGPLDGWGLSPSDLAMYLSLVGITLRRLTWEGKA